MYEHLLNNHSCFVTSDLDHSRELLSQFWQRHEIQVHNGWKYSVRWHQAYLKRTALSYTDSPTSLHIVSAPQSNAFRFVVHLSGYATHRLNGQVVMLSPEAAGLHAPGQEIDIDTQPFRGLALTLDGPFVEPALRRRFGTVPPFEDWARCFCVGAGPVACLKSMCLWMAYEMDRPARGC